MILAGDLRKGSKLLFRNEPYIVIDFQQVKPGKGGTYARTKMKNLITGLTHEETFNSGEKLEIPDLEYREVMYAYKDGENYQFIDQESYEELSFTKKQLNEVADFLKEQEIYSVLNFNGQPIGVTAPNFMELKVIETVPGVRGDTAQGAANKPAKLETGITIQVPLFVIEGDVLKVDTRDSSYIERIDKKK